MRLKTGNELQEIQCDGAKEFVEGIANDKNWAGVTISSSSAHSPEENGRAERMNQTRSNTSITLLSQSRLDKRFWPFSERMAATHINYTVPEGEGRTRWEILTGEKPDYVNIHPFGCHAFCHVPKESRKALDPKSRPGIYIGESEKKSGVIVWDPKLQRVFESNSTLYDYKRFGPRELISRFEGKQIIPEYYQAQEINVDPFTGREQLSAKTTNIQIPLPKHPTTGDSDDDEPPTPQLGEPENPPTLSDSNPPSSSTEVVDEVETPKRKPGRPRKEQVIKIEEPSDPKEKEEEIQPRRSERNAGKAAPMYSQTFTNRVTIEEEKGKKGLIFCDNDARRELPEWQKGPNMDMMNICLIAQIHEADPRIPRSFLQAWKDPDWNRAMHKEVNGMWTLKVWRLVPPPKPGPNVVIRSGVWTHRIKPKDDSHKSRLSYNGSGLKHPNSDVYSGAPRWESINLMSEISASLGVPLKSGDIPMAYLQADMPNEGTKYYMYQPTGFVDQEHPDYVLELLKPMYGLPIAGKLWKEAWVKYACNSIGFVQMKSDPCVFKLEDDRGGVMYLALFTDDDLSCCTSPELESKVFSELEKRFKYKNDGICTWFLGAKMMQDCTGVRISQEAFINNLVEKYEEYGIRKRDTPGEAGLCLREPEQPYTGNFPMSQITGSLLWIMKTRPEICFAVTQCCRFTTKFDQTHIDAVLHILGYLKKYPDLDLLFRANHETAQATSSRLKFMLIRALPMILSSVDPLMGT